MKIVDVGWREHTPARGAQHGAEGWWTLVPPGVGVPVRHPGNPGTSHEAQDMEGRLVVAEQ